MASFNTPEYCRLRSDAPDQSINGQAQNSHQVNLPVKTPTVRYVPNSGWSRYKSAFQTLIPFRRTRSDVLVLPIDKVGFFSYITFSWLFNTVHQTDVTEIPSSSPLDSCDINGQRLHHIFREEALHTGQKELRMFTVFWRFVRTRTLAAAIIHMLGIIFNINAIVIFMKKLLTSKNNEEALIWTSGIVLSQILSALLLIVSLLGTDGQKIYDAVFYGTHVIVSPIVFLYSVLSILFFISDKTKLVNILISMFPYILTYLLLYMLVRLGGYVSSRGNILCRQRVALVHEMLTHIRSVKMTLWENVLSRHLKGTRQKELKFLWRQYFCDGFSKLLLNVIPVMAVLLYLFTIGEQDISKVILLIALFCGFMRDSLYSFWYGYKKILEALPSLERFKNIMMLVEVKKFTEKPINRYIAINIDSANFTWDNLETHNRKEKKNKKQPMNSLFELSTLTGNDNRLPALRDISFHAPKGKLIGVCGIGKSGKTSLLLAILGHLHQTYGQVLRDGSCAYVGQRPWIWNATIQENILFKEPFNKMRYYECLLNCCLTEDINTFPHNDGTQIDEMSLPPGQKQRIALARALYANRDIYLLDNPLSLVDADMAASIFEKSILIALKNRTVVLATRHIQFLTRCDEIYILDRGEIIASGTHEMLLKDCPPYSSIIKAYTHENSKKYFIETNRHNSSTTSMTTFLSQHIDLQSSSSTHSIELGEDENVCRGESSKHCDILPNYGDNLDAIDLNRYGPLRAYVSFLNSGSTYFIVILGLMALVISTLCLFSMPVIIINFQKIQNHFQIILMALLFIMLFAGFIWSFMFMKVVIGVSQRTHNSWFEKLCRAPVGYFQASTAMMFVLNLFSLDIHDLDYTLPSTLSQLLHNTSLLLCLVSIVLYLSPYCVIVLLFTVMITLLWLARKHRKCILKLYAIEVGSRAPLYQHVSNTVTGRTYIQAFAKEKEFIADFTKHCDNNITCTFLLSAANLWLAFRIRVIGALTVGIVAVVLILTEPVNWFESSNKTWICGLTLVIVVQVGQCLHRIMQAGCESTASLNLFAESSQCIQGIQSEQQKIKIRSNKPLPANWPTDGSIVFENVKTGPLPHTSQVLDGMSFKIESGQKI
ncbi:hypothetical protein L9F63_018316, partial [Diploptera punctata]